jgi:hypothetical protein
MFESSHPFAFFNYFRVPYREVRSLSNGVPGYVGRLRATPPGGRLLLWLRDDSSTRPARDSSLGRYRMGGMPIVGHVLRDEPPRALAGSARGWQAGEAILDDRGRQVAAVWTDGAGSVFVPFDPGEVMRNLWSERYTTIGRAAVMHRLRGLMVRSYYAVRPLLPRHAQLGLRRAFARQQAVPAFPAWPAEHGLHDLYDWLFATVANVANAPVPWLDPWPDGKSCAFVLTHDVETHVGLGDIDLLREPERGYGYRSSWNLVGERYAVPAETVRRLQDEGCEIGVHGLRHDGRDLASPRLLRQRLPAMQRYAAQWGAVGFRSPATIRSWTLMPRLGFTYDTSYTDTDPYEPQPGGCCTYLPFFNKQLVELPITLPQDHTLFEILRHEDGKLWIEKARDIRDRGGMVLVLAHPDYARDSRLATAWDGLLAEFAGDSTVWHALPHEVATWWRERAASRIVRDGAGWRVDGPAASAATVRLAVPASAEGAG